MRFSKLCLAVALLALSSLVHAKDLGVIGPVYPIAEPNLLEMILARPRSAQASGELTRLQESAQRQARHSVENPMPVTTVSRATKARTYHHDPSIVVPYPITDADGRILVPPGTRVNPLDTVSLSKALLFFDARDSAQVQRAKSLLDARGGRVKLILTGGGYLELMKRWQVPVFYDQQGTLVEKLQIRHVPALVTQDGKRLRIDELP